LDRLDLQHQLFLLTLGGSLNKAPLESLPNGLQNVLDLGTGTGIWAIDFADTHSSAKVIGTDLSPIQPIYVPPNCHFYVDDWSQEWTFDDPFDYIHARMLVIAARNWRQLMQKCFDNLIPGGWVEFQDLHFPLVCDDGSSPPDSNTLQWSNYMLEGAKKLGIDLGATDNFPQWLSEAGFVDIHVEKYAWPINRWAKSEKEKEKGMWMLQNIQEGIQGFSMGLFTRGLGWRAEKVEVLLSECRKEFVDRSRHVYLPIGAFWARRPLQ
jgi:SAM-dependent methyltransferase